MLNKQPVDLLRTTAAATGLAIVLVMLVFALAKAVGEDLVVVPEFGSAPAAELTVILAVGATVAGGAMGLGLAAVARKFTPWPRTSFLAACVFGLIGYGVLAFVRAEQASTAIWLNAMHAAAALPIVGRLTFLLAPSKAASEDARPQETPCPDYPSR